MPAYVSRLDVSGASPHGRAPEALMWEAGTTDARALSPNLRNSRKRNAAGYSCSDGKLIVGVGIVAPRTYQLALYFVDWDRQGGHQDVELLDTSTLHPIMSGKTVSDHADGTYLIYTLDRSVRVTISAPQGKGAILSGLFFDNLDDVSVIKDFGIKDYVTMSKDLPRSETKPWKLVCTLPYNCHFQPRIQVEGDAGHCIHFNSSNPLVQFLTPTESVETQAGDHLYEAQNWVSGEGAIYTIPAGVTVTAVQYHETGYDTQFAGAFVCNDSDYNTLWNKGARTAYICMREWFYDCPDRERVGFWGDGTPELNQCFYAFDQNSHRLCKDLVLRKLEPKFYPGQHLEFLGEYGLWFYYMHSGDLESLRAVYDQTRTFLMETYTFGNPRTWFDWGAEFKDTAVIETCFFYNDLQTLKKIALLTGHESDVPLFDAKLDEIQSSFDSTYWKGRYFMSSQVVMPDDRANAMAVNVGLAHPDKWNAIYENVLSIKFYASNFFDRWVFEALSKMGRQEAALLRMYNRYKTMIPCRFTTLWEVYDRWWASCRDAFEAPSSLNHGWNPPVIFLSQNIAGVAPEAPGWAIYHVLPKEAFLTSIKVVVPSLKGNVMVELQKTASRYSLRLISPAATIAIVGIPKCSFSQLNTIAVGDVTVWDGSYCGNIDGLSWNSEDTDYVKFNVIPGAWDFCAHGVLPMTSPKPLPPPPSDDVKLSRKSWVASSSVPDASYLLSSENIPVDISAANALDGDAWTGWRDMTRPQYPGQWFQVDMQVVQGFHKIVLDTTWALWDSPDRYAVTVSNDGVSWSAPIAEGRGELGITTLSFAEQCARYIRVTQTGMSILYNWSIYEFDVYQKPL
ncbi:MAG: discoidin domain-containing protein, partial [Verrucomicrobia bacterium]|nr:discoidin domain-containing protein [Verrucomicrobiota bacterium]